MFLNTKYKHNPKESKITVMFLVFLRFGDVRVAFPLLHAAANMADG